ncbi:(2Fe-2S)-binding protein [Paenibacillus kribbensis]|uniref:(2Fe-2S)-binding protein n=1 Tax=Paenibacillus kribbensis TaxID=172713 RepID=UPI002DBCC24B|nr:(2Fe-2S)-binding protein [Paenibacillus kribbensis]MEC0232930.1 (2Fe-2S)-binding protein [Paenibacillus kribbensis]
MSKRETGRGESVGTEVQGEGTRYEEPGCVETRYDEIGYEETRYGDARYAGNPNTGNPYADSQGGQSGALGASSHLLVCRCEEVSLAQLEQACHMGADTVRQLKMATRVTMGACQGRVCRQLVETWFYSQYPAARREAELLSQRPPVRPVTFGQLAEGGSL